MSRRLIVFGVVLALAAAAYLGGAGELLRDPEQMKRALLGWGPWGYVVYVVSFALLEPLGIPGVLWIVPASLVWPKPLAFALSMFGGVGAGIIGFTFARYLARDWVERNMPPRFRRYDERLAQHGLWAVVLVRLVFFLAPPSHWALGLSRVSLGRFVLGSTLGIAPGVAAFTFLGGGLFEWLGSQPAWVWGVVLGAISVAIAVRFVLQRRRARETLGPAIDQPPQSS